MNRVGREFGKNSVALRYYFYHRSSKALDEVLFHEQLGSRLARAGKLEFCKSGYSKVINSGRTRVPFMDVVISSEDSVGLLKVLFNIAGIRIGGSGLVERNGAIGAARASKEKHFVTLGKHDELINYRKGLCWAETADGCLFPLDGSIKYKLDGCGELAERAMDRDDALMKWRGAFYDSYAGESAVFLKPILFAGYISLPAPIKHWMQECLPPQEFSQVDMKLSDNLLYGFRGFKGH
ncbi:uncharacterized protein Ecym_4437 [Eremothecium cymbalariae DBVPG|uniref:Uncharacterized protein n=1 Tax=Eremothecium cymbalariae (strain CBS 270.75 / DBVPG 7215 / KCTC 17166 / NRRL Y-17582) TaxID=931890 RepID=G8JTY0_ERECY|nr:hypothetical protein Ecym_4437 [Eremothecium cymbalariae DBVPG\